MTHRSSSFSAVICHTVCCFIGYSYCFAFFPSSPSSTSSQQSSFWCSAPSSALGVVQPGFWYLSSVPVLTDCQIPTLTHFPHWPRPDPSIVPWAKLFPAHLGASWAHLSTRMKTLPTSHMQNSSCPAHYTHTSLLLCRGHCLRNLLHTSDQCSHPYIPVDPPPKLPFSSPYTYGEVIFVCLDSDWSSAPLLPPSSTMNCSWLFLYDRWVESSARDLKTWTASTGCQNESGRAGLGSLLTAWLYYSRW